MMTLEPRTNEPHINIVTSDEAHQWVNYMDLNTPPYY